MLEECDKLFFLYLFPDTFLITLIFFTGYGIIVSIVDLAQDILGFAKCHQQRVYRLFQMGRLGRWLSSSIVFGIFSEAPW